MKKISALLPACLLILALSDCSKYTPSSQKPGELAGTWNWVKTDGGFGFHIHDTPASTGKTIQWKFTSDGRYSIYQNGSLVSQGNYTLKSAKSIRDHSEKKVIHFEGANEPDWMILELTHQQLEITDNNYDGVSSIYSRAAAH